MLFKETALGSVIYKGEGESVFEAVGEVEESRATTEANVGRKEM